MLVVSSSHEHSKHVGPGVVPGCLVACTSCRAAHIPSYVTDSGCIACEDLSTAVQVLHSRLCHRLLNPYSFLINSWLRLNLEVWLHVIAFLVVHIAFPVVLKSPGHLHPELQLVAPSPEQPRAAPCSDRLLAAPPPPEQ